LPHAHRCAEAAPAADRGLSPADYAGRISEPAKANEVLTSFHALRRRDIEAGGRPTIRESLARLQAQKS